jgi:BON domain
MYSLLPGRFAVLRHDISRYSTTVLDVDAVGLGPGTDCGGFQQDRPPRSFAAQLRGRDLLEDPGFFAQQALDIHVRRRWVVQPCRIERHTGLGATADESAAPLELSMGSCPEGDDGARLHQPNLLLKEGVAPDADIQREIAQDLIPVFLSDLDRFTVVVKYGIVTIDGTPETASAGYDIVDAARHVEGVVAVRDRLSYPADAP